jgi:hypothetical protein
MALRTAFRPELSSLSLDFQIELGAVALRARAAGGELKVVQIAPPAPPVGGALPAGEPQLRFTTGPGIRHLIAGTLSPAGAVKEEVITIEKGSVKLLERFATLFRIEA